MEEVRRPVCYVCSYLRQGRLLGYTLNCVFVCQQWKHKLCKESSVYMFILWAHARLAVLV